MMQLKISIGFAAGIDHVSNRWTYFKALMGMSFEAYFKVRWYRWQVRRGGLILS